MFTAVHQGAASRSKRCATPQDCALGDSAPDCAVLLSLAATPGWGLWAGAWNASGGSPLCGGSVTINGNALPLNPWAGITCTSASDASVMSLVLSGRGLQGSIPAALGSLASLQACSD